MHTEHAIDFDCEGEQLFGILSLPVQPNKRAVLLIVGGPQYRAGSHRQFTQLGRALADAGYAVLRFDYRGMGDSSGRLHDFEHIDADIRAAADALQAHCPQVEEIILWGLCDAASAACMYAPQDARVRDLILLNPWVRDANSYARTQVKHYYGARMLQGTFWRKLLGGEVRILEGLRESLGTLYKSMGRAEATPQIPFQARMLHGWRDFPGRTLLLLSGRDLTAQEFKDRAASTEWCALLDGPRVRRVDLPEADHTFSAAAWKKEVEGLCIRWLDAL